MREATHVEVGLLKLKVGTLEVHLNSAGRGTIKVDGKPLVCNRLDIHLSVGHAPVVIAEIVPIKPEDDAMDQLLVIER